MTVVTILAPDQGVVEIGQHCVMGVIRAACCMEGMIKVSRNLRMTHDTGSRNACISRGTALQGSVLIARRGHIGMTRFTVAVVDAGTGDDIAGAVTGSGSTRGCT